MLPEAPSFAIQVPKLPCVASADISAPRRVEWARTLIAPPRPPLPYLAPAPPRSTSKRSTIADGTSDRSMLPPAPLSGIPSRNTSTPFADAPRILSSFSCPKPPWSSITTPGAGASSSAVSFASPWCSRVSITVIAPEGSRRVGDSTGTSAGGKGTVTGGSVVLSSARLAGSMPSARQRMRPVKRQCLMRAFRSLVEERRPLRQLLAAPRAGLLALGLGGAPCADTEENLPPSPKHRLEWRLPEVHQP